MNAHADSFNRGGRTDPVRKDPMTIVDKPQTRGYMAMYGTDKPIAALPDDYPTLAIFLLGHELNNYGLLGQAEAISRDLASGVYRELPENCWQPAQTWALRRAIKAKRYFFAVRAMSGWYE